MSDDISPTISISINLFYYPILIFKDSNEDWSINKYKKTIKTLAIHVKKYKNTIIKLANKNKDLVNTVQKLEDLLDKKHAEEVS